MCKTFWATRVKCCVFFSFSVVVAREQIKYKKKINKKTEKEQEEVKKLILAETGILAMLECG